MYATRENRRPGSKPPCLRHSDYGYTYFLDATLLRDAVLGGARPPQSPGIRRLTIIGYTYTLVYVSFGRCAGVGLDGNGLSGDPDFRCLFR